MNLASTAPASRRILLVGTVAMCTLAASPQDAYACLGTPPPPMCGKSLVMAKAAPPVVVIPVEGDTSFEIPYTLYLQLLDFPAGTGICPEPVDGVYSANVSMTVDCGDNPGAVASQTVAIVPGFNQHTMQVTMAGALPSQCSITGTATLGMADGMTITASGDQHVCLSAGSQQDPARPLLDMVNLTDPILHAHPGDQRETIMRVTNNHQELSFSGRMTIAGFNTARMPGVQDGGVAQPGTGVFAISDPLEGDDPVIGFVDRLVNGSLFMPRTPSLVIEPLRSKRVTVQPGQSVDVPVYSRLYGMCADGSCSEMKVEYDGVFSDGTEDLACTGFVHVADSSVPPDFGQPGSGSVARLTPLSPSLLAIEGAVAPERPIRLSHTAIPGALWAAETAVPIQPVLQNINSERARYGARAQLPTPLPVDAFFDIHYNLSLDNQALDGYRYDIRFMRPIAPTGFEDIHPSFEIRLAHVPPETEAAESYFDLTYQLDFAVIDETGARFSLPISAQMAQTGPNRAHLVIESLNDRPEGLGALIDSVEITMDVRAFARANADTDLDEVTDDIDNCPRNVNTPQIDTNGDNIGNQCDADFAPIPNDCVVGFDDLNSMQLVFFASEGDEDFDPDMDINLDGTIDFSDLNVVKIEFFRKPGPGGIPNDCDF